jgi:hypothetical protein
MDTCTGGAIHTSLEGNGASDDVMEISPTQVRKGGMFSGVGNDLPGGGMKKTKHRKHHRGEFKDSSEDEGSSDCEVIAHGKSKGHGRHRRANSESSEDDQSPQVSCSTTHLIHISIEGQNEPIYARYAIVHVPECVNSVHFNCTLVFITSCTK